jgi:hypothetical protein
MSEDKAEMTQILSLMKNVGTACGHNSEGDFLRTHSFTTDSFRR